MTEDEKALVALEAKLGLIPRRELKQQLEMTKRDLLQTSQLFNSIISNPAQFDIRQPIIFARQHVLGILSKNFKD